jgi:hypothetical protein
MLSKFLHSFKKIFQQSRYSSELETYINRHNPKDVADVERLTVEFNMRQAKEFYKF